ncbi:MAG: hypothetical protein ACFFDK_09905 [Promethearchaeota archaeon]
MGIEELNEFEILQGVLSLAIGLIGIIIGLIIIMRYFEYKRKELIGVGLAILLTTISWMASGISFLSLIIYGALLDEALYLFIAYGFTLFAALCMMYAIISLLYPKPAMKIILTFLVITIAFEIIFVYMLLTNIEVVGAMAGKFDSESRGVSTLMVLTALVASLIVRILLIRNFSKSGNKKLQWRGRFILAEFILLIIGVIMDALLTLTVPMLILARILLVLRLIFVYLGWLLPDRVAKWLIKTKE